MRKLLLLAILINFKEAIVAQTLNPSGSITICPATSKTLTVSSAPAGTIFQWYTGTPSTGTIIPGATLNTFNVGAAGSYWVKLSGTVKDTLGPVVVSVASVPVANFTYSPTTTQCGNTPITFTSTSGAGLTYTWQFNDPASGSDNSVTTSSPSVVHKFKGTPGIMTQSFTVKMVVTNSAGCEDSTTHQVTINQLPGPVLTGTGQITFQGQTYFKQCSTSASDFTFTDQSNPAPNLNYEIIWGDNSPGFTSTTSPGTQSHTYNVGNYNLKYVVKGTNGCIDTANYGVFVGDAPNGGIGTENPVLTGCTGTTFNFPFLPSVFTNSAGTFYYLSVDDGTPQTVYSQPPPASYMHTFNRPSCGNSSGNNYFTVSLIIKNPCNVIGIPGTIGGIKISSTPNASFTQSKDTSCINQVVSFTDQSINSFVDESGNCSPGKSLWSISPGVEGTDWAIISGTRGSDKNSIFPSDWIAGANVLQVRFINPGTYSIKLKTGGSNQCGLDSVTKTICVNPLPKVNFSLASDTLCSSLVDSVIYSPATEFCGKNIYKWEVSAVPIAGCAPITGNYNYVDGTDSLSARPHFKFLNAGVYTIRLTAYSPGRSCFDIAEKKVVVKSVPLISLPANGGVCQNQPVNFTNTVSCFIANATYNWTFPGSSLPSSNLPVPPSVIYPNTGNFSVTLNVSNDCGISTAVERLIVDTIVAAHAGTDTTLCGNLVTMSANSPGTANGIWSLISGPNIPTITAPSSASTTITGLVTGKYLFKWKIFNGGCADSSTVTINIVPGPSIANAGPDQLLCLDSSTTFAANTPVTGTGKWNFVSGPNTPVITNASLPTSTVTGLKPGIYIFTWSISFSNCSPSVDTIQIKINDNPTVANAGSDQTICSPSVTLIGNNPIAGNGEWSLFRGPNSPFITSPEMPSTSVTEMISGTYFFIWKINNEPCAVSSDTVQINVSTIADNVISKDQLICINTMPASISGSIPSGGDGNYSYQWQQSIDSGTSWANIDTAINSSYSPGVLTQSVCFRRIVKTNLCPFGDTSNRVCVTVSPDAHALFTASSTILCAPANVDSFITLSTFPDRNLQYNWYENNTIINGTVNGLPPSFIINNPGEDVTIKLLTTSPFGCKPDSMSILFRTLPSVTAKFTKNVASGCGPLSVNFTNTSTILDNSVAFFWDFGNRTVVSNAIQPAPVIYDASSSNTDTTYYITLKAFSGCDTSVMRDSVRVFANPKARFTSIATGCSPFRDTIVNNSFGADASTKYYWDFGDNTKDTTFTSGKIYHIYNTGTVDTFSIRLIAENRCSRDTQLNNVVVSPNVIQPGFSINGSELYGCAPHTITFQNGSLGASVLTFDFGDGTMPVVIPNTQPDITHTYANPGDYVININLQNSCTDTTAIRNISVYPAPLASFNLIKSVLCNRESVYTNNISANANSYQWLWGDGTSTSAFNASHVYSNSGTYSIRLVAGKINAFGTVCTDTSSSTLITIVDRIPALININSGNACAPYTIKVSADGADNAGQVNWYFYDNNVSSGISHASGQDASYTYLNDGLDSVKLVVTNTAGCIDSTVKEFAIHKTPRLDFTPVNAKTCNTDTSITFNVTPNYTGTDPLTYEWYINDQISGNSNPFIYHFQATAGITAVNPFSIKVIAKNTFGCGDTSLIGNVTIQTLARQYIAVLPSIVQEQPHYTFTFTDSAEGLPNSAYLWKTGDRNGQQLPGKQVTYTYGDTGTFHVNLLVQDYETGCFEKDSVTVYVLAVPGYLYVPNAFCPGCQKAELRQFLPLGKGLKDYHLVIFNIWGQKVFETTRLDANGIPNEPWNGNWVSGQNTQQGAFSWYIEAHYINGAEWKGMLNPKTNKLEKQGFISIIR